MAAQADTKVDEPGFHLTKKKVEKYFGLPTVLSVLATAASV